jgi:hypothetical protein
MGQNLKEGYTACHALRDLRQRTLEKAGQNGSRSLPIALRYFHGCAREASNRAQEIVPI